MPLPPPPNVETYFQFRVTDRADLGTFGSVRRLRVNLGGGDRETAWLVQLFTKGGNRSVTDEKLYIQDAWVRKTLPGGATLQVGQTRPPFSRERQTGDRFLLLPDRPGAVDSIMPGGGLPASFARDLGATWSRGNLSAGVYGGNGTLQQKGRRSGPLLALRYATTDRPGMSAGFSAAYRRDRSFDASRAFPGTSTLGFDRFTGDDLRLGLEAVWRGGRCQVLAEWLQADLRGSGRLHASGG
jgi:phosphate-selective porin